MGFLGSFGHCIGMCGPLTAAVALSPAGTSSLTWRQQLYHQCLLNVGRLVSYGLVGMAIGAVGSLLIAGGHLAGIGSPLRRGIALLLGTLLIWIGLSQVLPVSLPKVPMFQPLAGLHQRLSSALAYISRQPHWWTPIVLGWLWGLIPCGFLYIAQIKAAETSDPVQGAATMLAFGLGTLPTMVGTGLVTARISRDRRSQLYQLGGWVTLTIGILTLCRTDAMVDYSGYGALICLVVALIARPISPIWAFPLRYRRTIGVSAFVLSLIHTAHMLDHSFNWNVMAIVFTIPTYQIGIVAGVMALMLMLPAALTSTDAMVNRLGNLWRKLHLLTVPALLLVGTHTILVGSNYLGALAWSWQNWLGSALLALVILGVLLIRSLVIP
ncbi:MAG: sulfite exporter TauE/SafE family protein [Cyanobacteria bacterium]|nr:sulfite exporter TauE/SafE family protein [Cyanobacteriota bacterium]MDW8202656.1 sulfite exporter TauE/SafE family protein [Cyanobacteriota bacterium SKYGB_h_bin112]